MSFLFNVLGVACAVAVGVIVWHGLAQGNYVGVGLYAAGFLLVLRRVW